MDYRAKCPWIQEGAEEVHLNYSFWGGREVIFIYIEWGSCKGHWHVMVGPSWTEREARWVWSCCLVNLVKTFWFLKLVDLSCVVVLEIDSTGRTVHAWLPIASKCSLARIWMLAINITEGWKTILKNYLENHKLYVFWASPFLLSHFWKARHWVTSIYLLVMPHRTIPRHSV